MHINVCQTVLSLLMNELHFNLLTGFADNTLGLWKLWQFQGVARKSGSPPTAVCDTARVFAVAVICARCHVPVFSRSTWCVSTDEVFSSRQLLQTLDVEPPVCWWLSLAQIGSLLWRLLRCDRYNFMCYTINTVTCYRNHTTYWLLKTAKSSLVKLK